MIERRGWLRVSGGILCLIGLVGFYVVVLSEPGRSGRHFEGRSLIEAGWALALALGVFCSFLANVSKPLGHWYQLIEGLKYKPTDLYKGVKDHFREQAIPGSSVRPKWLFQRGILSAKRRHLCIRRDSFRFELYATPFGTNFGVSWRCYEKTPLLERILLSLPAVRWLLYVLLYRFTTYHEDCGLFFQECAKRSVRRAIEEVVSDQGLRALTDAEFQPVLEGMKRRWS